MSPRVFLAVALLTTPAVIPLVAAPAPEEKPAPLGFRADAKVRARMLAENGGNAESEATVARGLAWLARQQQKDGSWPTEVGQKDPVASTGMALLAFLGAGETHRNGKKYREVVQRGVAWLVAHQRKDGGFDGAGTQYVDAIGALALVEAFGTSGDPKLQAAAQNAVNQVVEAQDASGSWGYKPGTRGDTSITGWQVQTLHAASVCGLQVPAGTLQKTGQFLDSVQDAEGTYGYTAKGGTPNLTAVGMYCRERTGWAAKNESLRKSVAFLRKRADPGQGKASLYCWLYAAPALRDLGGDDWEAWNGKARDRLVKGQENAQAAEPGSWNPDADVNFGFGAGRILNSAAAILTLEVYYRYPSVYPRNEKKPAE